VAGSCVQILQNKLEETVNNHANAKELMREGSINMESRAGDSLIAPVENQRAAVHLDADHPGFRDQAYRARRDQIAAIAVGYEPGTPVPDAPYTKEENEVWQVICEALEPQHARYACAEYLECVKRLDLPRQLFRRCAKSLRASKRSAGSGWSLSQVSSSRASFWNRWQTECFFPRNTYDIIRRLTTRRSRTWCMKQSAML
jgi:hypothetical protein